MFTRNRNRSYTNGEITIFWQGDLCTHSTLCYNKLRAVFDPIRRPWINADGASTKEILSVIEECPSPALMFRWNDQNRNKSEKSKKLYTGDIEGRFTPVKPTQNEGDQVVVNPTKVDLRPNGPIVISGNFTVVNNGQTMPKVEMISLCRCGASGNLPYCDGTHFKIGFHTP